MTLSTHRPTRRAARPIAAALLVPAASLAAPSGGGTLLHVSSAALEASTGVIAEAVALHADDDGRLDVIARVGDDLVFLSAPDPMQHSSALGLSGVTAHAALALAGGGADGIVCTNAAGLEFIVRDPANSRAYEPVRSTVAGASWASARSLAVVDIDGDGDEDVLGLSEDGSKLLRAERTGEQTFVELSPLTLVGDHSELTALRWTAGAVALATVERTAGLPDDACSLMGLDGIPFRTIVPGGEIRDLARIGAAASTADGLAILADGFVSVARPGGIVEAAVDLTVEAPSAIGMADVDGDGRDELLANSTTAGEVTVLWNAHDAGSGTVTYSNALPGDVLVIPLDSEVVDFSGQRCAPLGADFDRDGDVDVLQFVEPERALRVRRGDAVPEEVQRPHMEDISWTIDPSGLNSGISMDVKLPALPGGAGSDWLEVLVATNPVGAAPSVPLAYRAVRFEPITGTSSGETVGLWVPFSGELGDRVSITLRCLSEDTAAGVLDVVGVDGASNYVEVDLGTDGGGNGNYGGTGGPDQNKPTGTPPPPPPVPVGT